MKKISLLLTALFLLLLTQSCNKRCQCYRYDGGIEVYTTDELSTLGKTCSEMIYYNGLATQRYSVCEWEY
jgi:hypothetical protein